MSQHFGRIGAMVNGRAPYDAKSALENAETVENMSHLPWAGFVPASEGISPRAVDVAVLRQRLLAQGVSLDP